MESPLATCPPTLKQIQHYLKLAQEHDARDVVVAYWARFYALQVGLKLSKKEADERKFLLPIIDWLERTKNENAANEAITNEVCAQAHFENYALKLFLFADKQDRQSNFGKKVVKAFYSCGVLYDVLQIFGELGDESARNRKYAKWKAAYIHNCLKNGQTPIPGPVQDSEYIERGGDKGCGNIGAIANNPVPEISKSFHHFNTNAELTDEPKNPENDKNVDCSPPAITSPNFEEALNNPSKLPNPPIEQEKPGGFVPYVPPAQSGSMPPNSVESLKLTADQMMKAQKYCKYAESALNFDDEETAIEYLRKALNLLTTEQENSS